MQASSRIYAPKGIPARHTSEWSGIMSIIHAIEVQSASNPRYTCPTDDPAYLVLSRLPEDV